MSTRFPDDESPQNPTRQDLCSLTPNERFWLEVIRLASWDSDPAPTLELVQELRRIFEPASRGSAR